YCLIGKRLPHSFSKIIHQSLGLDYSLVELKDERAVAEFVQNNDYAGYNVTIPYKQTVIPYLDELDESAQRARAVNTVIQKDGKRIGYNTDTEGMAAGLNRIGAKLQNRKVMILGSGGTASMARALAVAQGANKIVTVSRSGKVHYGNYGEYGDTEVLINCTPVGMYPNNGDCPVDLEKLPQLKAVFDAVYNPLTTRLIQFAKAKGIAAGGGLSMLVAQAVIAENLFLGCNKFDVDTQTEKTTAEIYKAQSNIVLVGMPSCGKTSVGRALGALCGKSFVDTDSRIEDRAGQTIPEIFASIGESGFRKLEKQVIQECARGFGQVIATGGGAVLDDENRIELKQNSVVFWLMRETEKLKCEGRPLSKDKKALQAMEKIRFPLYNKVKDYAVDCNGSIMDCVKEIKEIFDAHFGY
ncbi:MAG: shikimate kinase, partial [Clostridia bacterium]|nr:shikimate kinase [Clostridia bacterium]